MGSEPSCRIFLWLNHLCYDMLAGRMMGLYLLHPLGVESMAILCCLFKWYNTLLLQRLFGSCGVLSVRGWEDANGRAGVDGFIPVRPLRKRTLPRVAWKKKNSSHRLKAFKLIFGTAVPRWTTISNQLD